MSNPLEARYLPGTPHDPGKAVWRTFSHAPLQRATQAERARDEHLPLSTLELDVLHTALGLSTHTRDVSARQYDSKQHLYTVLATLALTIKAKDPQLYLHSRRVQSLANSLVQAMNLPKDQRMIVGLAALFHDIGKIHTDDALLYKSASLTSQEFEVIKEHPAHGALILGRFQMLKNVVPMVYHHHERWDGNGYPGGLQGESIPLGARIVAVADAYEVMTSHRPYQPTRTPAEALEELYLCAGTQFDPHLVEWFSTLVADQSALGTQWSEAERVSILRPLRFGGINLRPVAQPNPTSH